MFESSFYINGKQWLIKSETGASFECFEDGMFFYNMCPNDVGWCSTTNEIIKQIRLCVKNKKTDDAVKTSNKMSSLGLDNSLGIRRFPFDMKASTHIRLKSLGVNMTQFINSAILEKFEREGL